MTEKPTLSITEDGTKIWHLDGKRHRIDGPAVEYQNGTKFWLFYGKLHREDGPAIVRSDGTKEWFLNGERHRIDGPAIESEDGREVWYLFGKRFRSEEAWRAAVTQQGLSESKKTKLNKEQLETIRDTIYDVLEEEIDILLNKAKKNKKTKKLRESKKSARVKTTKRVKI